MGYAFYAEGRGKTDVGFEDGQKYPNPIIILIGLEDKETIKDILIVTQGETPQYWELLIKKNYLDQFKGLKVEDAYFKRFGGKIDSVSGATLSSTSILDIVREAILDKVLPDKIAPPEVSGMAWQVKLALLVMIPFILIPVAFIWYALIRGERNASDFSRR
jgi:hypothetical protein